MRLQDTEHRRRRQDMAGSSNSMEALISLNNHKSNRDKAKEAMQPCRRLLDFKHMEGYGERKVGQ